MPIRPEHKKYYGEDWKQLGVAIRHRAKHQCECVGECSQEHITSQWGPGVAFTSRCSKRDRENYDGVRVVLTVAHLCHCPECDNPRHLKAMCQGCHNRLDAPMRWHHRMEKRKQP